MFNRKHSLYFVRITLFMTLGFLYLLLITKCIYNFTDLG